MNPVVKITKAKLDRIQVESKLDRAFEKFLKAIGIGKVSYKQLEKYYDEEEIVYRR